MQAESKIKVLFIAGFGPIVRDTGLLVGVTFTPAIRKEE